MGQCWQCAQSHLNLDKSFYPEHNGEALGRGMMGSFQLLDGEQIKTQRGDIWKMSHELH